MNDNRVPVGRWIVQKFYGIGNNVMANAYWNPTLSRYEFTIQGVQFYAPLFLELERQVQSVYADLEVIDYPAGVAIRNASIVRKIGVEA